MVQDTINNSDKLDATKPTIKEIDTVILFINFLERKAYVSSSLNLKVRTIFIEFLHFNIDYFSWSHKYDKYSNVVAVPKNNSKWRVCID